MNAVRASNMVQLAPLMSFCALASAQTYCGLGDDFVLVRPDFIRWYVDSGQGLVDRTQFGLPGDHFAVGEPLAQYTDGYDDLVVARRSGNYLYWYLKANVAGMGFSETYYRSPRDFGLADDIPIVGKITSNSDQAAVKRGDLLIVDSNHNLQYDHGIDEITTWRVTVDYSAGERLLTGDYDRNLLDDLWVWRPGSRAWQCFLNIGIARAETPNFTVQFGLPNDIPCLMDYNGDGKLDIAVWRPGVNHLFINLWEPPNPTNPYGGYTPDEVDVDVNYGGSLPGGVLFDVAAFGMEFDHAQARQPTAPTQIQVDREGFCSSDSGIITLRAVGGEGAIVRWFAGVCGGTSIGTGESITIPSPAVTTLYSARRENAGPCSDPSGCASREVRVVAGPPVLTSHPEPRSACRGDNVMFFVGANGTTPFTFEWRRNGARLLDGPTGTGSTIYGSTTSRLEIVNCSDADEGEYSVVVANPCGSLESSRAGLTVGNPPSFMSNPEPSRITICRDGNTSITVQVQADMPVSYRWLRNGQPLFDGVQGPSGAIIYGSLTNHISIQNITYAEAGRYSCVASTNCGVPVPSPGSTLVQICVADFDNGSSTGICDGGVTIDDLLYYLSLLERGWIDADLDDGTFTGTPDGGVTIDDLLYFLFRFELGC